MASKKVLFYHDAFPGGGTERVTMDIADYISVYGYEVYVVAKKVAEFSSGGVVTLQMPPHSSFTDAVGIGFILDKIAALSIDIFVLPIHLNACLLQAIREKTDCKLVFALHSVPFWEIPSRLYGRQGVARGNFLKTLEWWLLTYPKTMWLKKYDGSIRRQHKRVYAAVDAYTVLCDEYKEQLLKSLKIPVGSDKIQVINNSEREVEDIHWNKKKQIVFIGRLSYEDKRADRLMLIWKKIYRSIPDWELIVVGDGPERRYIETKAAQLKLERVTFAGHQSDVHRFYRDASILCLTSNFEGWPLVLTEAQVNGVIPFAFGCTAGVRQILNPSGVNGVIVPPYNLTKYAKELLSLINNPEKMKEMQHHVVSKSKAYAPEVVGRKWFTLFENLLAK